MSALERVLVELGKNAVLSLFEPQHEEFWIDRDKVRIVRRTIRAARHDELLKLPCPVGRNDFVWAAAQYLKRLDHEELLVAFGTRRGRDRSAGASLRRVHRTVGERNRVPVTPLLRGLLEPHLEREGAEIVLIHNHPPRLEKAIIGHLLGGGWPPTPSEADRELAFDLLRQRAGHLMTAARPSSLKWFLVDQGGGIAEFTLPPMGTILDIAQSLPKV